MAKRKPKGQQLHDPSAQGLGEAQATAAGAEFAWHHGRVTAMGCHDVEGGRSVTIAWDEGGSSSQVGGLTDLQWEVLKLAFKTAGRVAVLSDEDGDGWMYDYRYLEALR